MFRKALVGVDFSPAEPSLLSCLPDLQRWGVEAVVLCHVIQIGRVQGSGYGHEEEYRDRLECDASTLRQVGLTVTISVTASGVPADELLAVARKEEADIVVVGSRSHNFLDRIFLGSVAKDVVRKSELPVLIERLEPTVAGQAETCTAVCSRSLDRILLATDLSAQSKSAEDVAVRLAATATHVSCLTVLSNNPSQDERLVVDTKHRELVRRIEDCGGHADSQVEHGDAADVIARVARNGYTLIIVGKHGQHWITSKIVGTTAARVCETAQRPVLMVPIRKE